MNKLKLDRNIPIVPRWRENLKEPSVNDLKWMIDRQLFWYCLFIFTNKFMNTTFMHLSIQLAQIRKFRIRHTFHFFDILGPAVEWSALCLMFSNLLFPLKCKKSYAALLSVFRYLFTYLENCTCEFLRVNNFFLQKYVN